MPRFLHARGEALAHPNFHIGASVSNIPNPTVPRVPHACGLHCSHLYFKNVNKLEFFWTIMKKPELWLKIGQVWWKLLHRVTAQLGKGWGVQCGPGCNSLLGRAITSPPGPGPVQAIALWWPIGLDTEDLDIVLCTCYTSIKSLPPENKKARPDIIRYWSKIVQHESSGRRPCLAEGLMWQEIQEKVSASFCSGTASQPCN